MQIKSIAESSILNADQKYCRKLPQELSAILLSALRCHLSIRMLIAHLLRGHYIHRFSPDFVSLPAITDVVCGLGTSCEISLGLTRVR